MSIRKDYIERLIEQFAAALANILKARREKRLADARSLIRETSLEILGMEFSTLLLADPASTAKLLGSATRVKVLARLVAEDGEALQQQGDAATAASRFEYALALYAEVEKLGLTLADEDVVVVTRLREQTGGT